MDLTEYGISYRGAVHIDHAKCVGCGTCYEVCPSDIFRFDRESHLVAVAYPEECWYCGSCLYDCPQNALAMELPLACL